ncbi:hypothetical protein NKH18_48790 [Streptomyces sp. M10(2022)]
MVHQAHEDQVAGGAQSPAAALLTILNEAARDQRQQAVRRPAYLEFLVRVDAALSMGGPTGTLALEERSSLINALEVLELVGPADVVETARHLALLAQHNDGSSPSKVEQARMAFLASARGALGSPPARSRAGDIGENPPQLPLEPQLESARKPATPPDPADSDCFNHVPRVVAEVGTLVLVDEVDAVDGDIHPWRPQCPIELPVWEVFTKWCSRVSELSEWLGPPTMLTLPGARWA